MSDPATLYVSCNPKEGPVARFGARGVLIGASRSASTPKVIDFRPEEVVAISGDEYRRHQQEYVGAIDSGALLVRDKAAHDAWLKLEDDRNAEAKAAAEKAAAEAAKAAKAAAKAEAKAAEAAEAAPTKPESESAQ